MTSDIWADDLPPAPAPQAAPAPQLTSNGVEVTLTFKVHGGYDAPWTVVKGPISDVAKAIAAEDNGKVSALAKALPAVDKYFKDQFKAHQAAEGKA